MFESPYLKNPDRLVDLIAAIQAMGSYRYYRLSPKAWSVRIGNDASETEVDKWTAIFLEHPEFFRFNRSEETVSLVLRRQKAKNYNVHTLQTISREDMEALNAEEIKRISRSPLTESELQFLISLAIEMASSALEMKRDRRWWVPILVTVTAAVLGLSGVLLGAYIKSNG